MFMLNVIGKWWENACKYSINVHMHWMNWWRLWGRTAFSGLACVKLSGPTPIKTCQSISDRIASVGPYGGKIIQLNTHACKPEIQLPHFPTQSATVQVFHLLLKANSPNAGPEINRKVHWGSTWAILDVLNLDYKKDPTTERAHLLKHTNTAWHKVDYGNSEL